jgi:hypothetical protein
VHSMKEVQSWSELHVAAWVACINFGEFQVRRHESFASLCNPQDMCKSLPKLSPTLPCLHVALSVAASVYASLAPCILSHVMLPTGVGVVLRGSCHRRQHTIRGASPSLLSPLPFPSVSPFLPLFILTPFPPSRTR